MQSIAIFPCSYTHGASVIGELSNCLRLKVYIDEFLFADVSKHFGIPVEKLKQVICGRTPKLHSHHLQKSKYINFLRCALEALSLHSPGRRLHYGLHTSLLELKRDKIFKVLVFDEEESRIQRAMRQEGLTKKVARQHIHRHDAKVSGWTRFLFGKEAYQPSLYQARIPLNNRSSLEITAEIAALFKDAQGRRIPLAGGAATRSVPGYNLCLGNQAGCTA